MTDGDRPLNNEWVLGPDPLDDPFLHKGWAMGTVRSKVPTGSVRERGMGTGEPGTVRCAPTCAFCGALTKQIGRRLFCRACGYFESCCDGGKEADPRGEGEC